MAGIILVHLYTFVLPMNALKPRLGGGSSLLHIQYTDNQNLIWQCCS